MPIQKKRLFNLDPNAVQDMPTDPPAGATGVVFSDATYTLHLDTSRGNFNFYFTTKGIVWPFSIYDNLNVTLQLDSALNWEFLRDDSNGILPMTIAKPDSSGDDEATRYWSPNISPVSYASNGKLQQINFSALKNTNAVMYHADPFNLYLRVYDSNNIPVEITLDPDMQNPGDPPTNHAPPKMT